MKPWIKGGLIGFLVAFLGLWIILFAIGYEAGSWKCVTIQGKAPCALVKFIFSTYHIGFVLFFSWVGFFAGVINSRKIRRIIEKEQNKRLVPLKITSTIVMTAVVVFAVIGILAFNNWVEVMIYAIIFGFFVVLVSWYIGKKKYGKR
ncbi:hypothetical protein HYT23_00045 [Candidatus Pacearchaeota archaeon]|nr:hypothetical protein [Candidatus Pacearchaeota archaeon]